MICLVWFQMFFEQNFLKENIIWTRLSSKKWRTKTKWRGFLLPPKTFPPWSSRCKKYSPVCKLASGSNFLKVDIGFGAGRLATGTETSHVSYALPWQCNKSNCGGCSWKKNNNCTIFQNIPRLLTPWVTFPYKKNQPFNPLRGLDRSYGIWD